MAGCGDTLAPEYLYYCHKEDFQIKQKRAVCHVPDVQIQFLLPGDGIATVDLGPSRDPGPDLMSASLHARVTVEVCHEQGPRSNQAHLAAKYIPELRKFIQAQAPGETRQGRKSFGIR